MCVERPEDVVVGAMIELADLGLCTILLCQVLAILFMQTSQHVILHSMDRSHSWIGTIVKGCRFFKLRHDLVALCAVQAYLH